MTRKILLLLIFTIGTLTNANAQCCIDKLVEEYSTVGRSKFTTAVERDPKTRKVKKVVKVLELSNANVDKFVDVFDKASKGKDVTMYDKKGHTAIVIMQSVTQVRIYSLECDDMNEEAFPFRRNTAKVKVTIIIKMMK